MDTLVKPSVKPLKKLEYGKWAIRPDIPELGMILGPSSPDSLWRRLSTKHEGDVLYHRQWNFWVRAGVPVNAQSNRFFRQYESSNTATDKWLTDIGFPWKKAETEAEVWDRIGKVWNWLRDHVTVNDEAYANISSDPEEWPSILDYAAYYATHGNLVWAACFSKAHLFATLLGRFVYPRYRFAIAETHHTEAGAPPTATHVYVAVYVADRWFYLDPTATVLEAFPAFASRRSIGVPSFTSVDYEHPYEVIPVPLSGLEYVPHLPA